MHNLAIALHRAGHQVSGSDDAIFDPSRSRLEKEGLLPEQMGWNANRISKAIEGVILGMHARPDNPELVKAKKLGIPVWSFPEYIYLQSRQKLRLAVCGSHGKTSITAMVMHVLQQHQQRFDYLVGAQLDGFEVMVQLSDAPTIVLEGDEYLASPTDREPKFLRYQPNLALLSGIAWDHVNVFPTYEIYFEQFRKLLRVLGPEGTLVYNSEDPEVVRLIEEGWECELLPYRCPKHSVDSGQLVIDERRFEVIGRHNLHNAAGAAGLCIKLGMPEESVWDALATFTGAARRLQVLGRNEHSTVIRDFAHSPSKVKASTSAVGGQFGREGFTAVFELHTFSSLNAEFLPQYKEALDGAGRAIVYYNPATVQAKKLPPISPEAVHSAFGREDLEVFTESQALQSRLKELAARTSTLLLMSSGPFGGMNIEKLTSAVLSAG